jgi:hypothetical protein
MIGFDIIPLQILVFNCFLLPTFMPNKSIISFGSIKSICLAGGIAF